MARTAVMKSGSPRKKSSKDDKAQKPKQVRIGSSARRNQLIDVAEGVFVREGYERASMEQIAREAGVTRTLVYQHFPAKRDLYMAVLDRVIPELVNTVVPHTDKRPKHPWRLLAGMRIFVTLLQEEGGALRLLLGEQPREPWIAEQLDRLKGILIDYFATEYKGVGSDAEVRLLAICILGMYESIGRRWSNEEKHAVDPEAAAQLFAKLMWGGIRNFDLPQGMVDEKYADLPPNRWKPDIEYLEALANSMPQKLRPGEKLD